MRFPGAGLVEVAAVAGGGRHDDSRVVVELFVQFGEEARDRRFLGAGVGVADLGRSRVHGGLDRRAEVREFFTAGLHQQHMAVLADRVGHLHVDRDLARPFAVLFGQRARLAFLVDLAEAAVRARARGQAERFVVHAQVSFRGRVVERVHHRDRLRRGRRRFGRQRVGGVQFRRVQIPGERVFVFRRRPYARGHLRRLHGGALVQIVGRERRWHQPHRRARGGTRTGGGARTLDAPGRRREGARTHRRCARGEGRGRARTDSRSQRTGGEQRRHRKPSPARRLLLPLPLPRASHPHDVNRTRSASKNRHLDTTADSGLK